MVIEITFKTKSVNLSNMNLNTGRNLIILFTVIFFMSCDKDNMETEFSLPTPEGLIHWDILKVEGENSINLNDTLILEVFFPRSSSCDYITHMLSDEHGNTILVKGFGSTRKNSPCLWFALPQILQYEFIPNMKGIYNLEFIKKDETKITHTVNVN